MALLTEHVEETYGTTLELRVLDAKLRHAFLYKAAQLTHLRYAAEVALHIGHETGHACLTECLGHHLQGNGLTCTCGSRNESMTVSHLTCNAECAVSAMGNVKPSFFVVHKIYSFNIFLQK